MDESQTLPDKPKHRNQHPPAVTKAKQRLFLNTLRQTGSIADSCRAANVDSSAPHYWASASTHFAKAFSESRAFGEKVLLDTYESTLDDTVLGHPDFDSVVRSQILRMFRMKRLDPRYRDNTVIAINNTGPVAMQLNFNASPQITQADTQADDKT